MKSEFFHSKLGMKDFLLLDVEASIINVESTSLDIWLQTSHGLIWYRYYWQVIGSEESNLSIFCFLSGSVTRMTNENGFPFVHRCFAMIDPVMHNFLIFLPEYEYESWSPGFLYGNVFHSETGTAIYILGPQLPDCRYAGQYEKIGEIGYKKPSSTSSHWLFIRMKKGNIEKISVIFEELYNVRVVVYNRDHIKRSQWLDQMPFQQNDFIFRLINDVKGIAAGSEDIPFDKNAHTFRLTPYLLCALQKTVQFSKNRWVAPFINISTFGVHFFNILESVEAVLSRFTHGFSLSVRDKNYISARMVDMLLGQIIIFYVMSHMSSAEMFSALSDFQEFVVAYLKNTVEWLMGSPAGFKLNCPLNNVLGPFYQFHISLWWTFLRLSKPLLWVIFHFLLFLGNFGLSLQVAILVDVLAIVSVHIYCIYVYAARLYFFQMKGLKILSRLFIGKKRNPLPGTEHSSPYTTEQLLFGTVSFTILLFLLPTTLIYYFVFTAIRVVIILLGGIFTRVRRLMMAFPIYVTWLWFYDPVYLTCTVRLSNKMHYLPDGTLVTKIKPICKSWWWTVQMITANCVPHSAAIEWKKLTTDVLVGNLIYPV